MNWAWIHAPVNKKRLFKSDKWKLFLERLRNAFNLWWGVGLLLLVLFVVGRLDYVLWRVVEIVLLLLQVLVLESASVHVLLLPSLLHRFYEWIIVKLAISSKERGVPILANTLYYLVCNVIQLVFLVSRVLLFDHLELLVVWRLAVLRVSSHHTLTTRPKGVLESEPTVRIVWVWDAFLLGSLFQVPLTRIRLDLSRTDHTLLRCRSLN